VASIFFYISGHGFGHASRDIEVINTLGRARPDLAIVVRTSVSRRLLDRTIRVPVTLLDGFCDTGVVQVDSLRLDSAATIARADEFYRTLDARATVEADLLRRHDARLVVSDAPPLACAAAALAGVPSVVLANFTWDWIYSGYSRELESAPELIPTIQQAYRAAEAAWRLPMHGGFETFDRIIDIPFIARRGRADLTPEKIRRTLALPDALPLALVSFGGFGLSGLPLDKLDCLDEFTVVIAEQASEIASLPSSIVGIDEEKLYVNHLGYEDLVRAMDVVITKPGYGIIADCLAGGTAMLYTSRGRFLEYDVLVREMPRFLRCAFIDQEDLLAGRWRDALRRVMAMPRAPEVASTNGAQIAVEMIRQSK
jgi:hypothetical protein